LDKDARLSSRLLGVDVVGARDGSCGYLYFSWLYLTAMPSHVGGGGGVDGLSLSRCVVVGGGAFFWRGGGVKPPET
jgi:hypothetical protein